MGHDISAYSLCEEAYLRRGAFDPHKNILYEALGCEDLNGGVSGYGDRTFYIEDITKALDKIRDNPDADREIEFLEKIVSKGLEEVHIQFG